MKFLSVAPMLFAAALAAPTPQTSDCPNPAHCGPAPDPNKYENIDISDYTLRKNDGIQSVSFTLKGETGEEIACTIGKVDSLPSPVTTCGDSDYRFGLTKPTDDFSDAGLAIYHQTSQFYGRWGTGSVPTYCHAGGNGINDFVCQQVNAVTIVIQYP